jgi:hypothetical protein
MTRTGQLLMLLNNSPEGNTSVECKKRVACTTSSARVLTSALLVAVALVASWTTNEVGAQTARLCSCDSDEPFGACNVGFFEYATEGELPGSATVAPDPNELAPGDPGPAPTFLYVADLFSGRSFRFPSDVQAGNLTLGDPDEFFSPGGTRSTSGLTFNPNTASLYWAITDVRPDASLNPVEVPVLVKTGVDLLTLRSPAENFVAMQSAVVIDLFALASGLGLPQVGKIGDLVAHEAENEFWAVDIVNNVYFAFGFDGKPIEVNGEIKHFRNPRVSNGDPAFGTFMTYVVMDGINCFDIAVGSLTDGEVRVVERVFAESGTINGVDFTYGDPVGLAYGIPETVGTDLGQITGIAHWKDSCGEGQNVEVLMDIGQSLEDARIRLASTDPSTIADVGVSRASCSSNENEVELTWRQYSDLSSLTITRIDLADPENDFQVLPRDGVDPMLSAGTHTIVDTRVPDAVYEYRFSATSLSGIELSDRRCLTSVGRGSVVDSVAFAGNSNGDLNPFGITYVGKFGDAPAAGQPDNRVTLDRLVVVDSESGSGHTFTTGSTGNMEYRTSFPGPFTDNFNFDGGLSVGVAWSESRQELTWLINLNGLNLVRTVEIVVENGEIVGVTPDTIFFTDASRVQAPLNIVGTPVLGDLDYDAFGDQFWAADRITGTAFSFDRNGALTGSSIVAQLPNPAAGVSRGGLSIADSTPSVLELDWIAGQTEATEQVRVLYGRSQSSDSERITLPGTETFLFDLRPGTGARNFAGLMTTQIGSSVFSYVVSKDTRRIYKVQISTGISGSEFRRGDANSDGSLNISDVIFMLVHQFGGTKTPICLDSADVQDDEMLTIDDPLQLFLYLFGLGLPPAPPFEVCGFDFEPGLSCEEASCKVNE